MREFTYWYLLPAVLVMSVRGVADPALAQTASEYDEEVSVPRSAFYVGLGGGFNSINFGDQDVIAIGTSEVTETGPMGNPVVIATGFAQGPDDATGGTPIYMDSQVSFSASVELGFFQHFARSDNHLWGAKLTNDYYGSTSHVRFAILPQVGEFTFSIDPNNPIPFTGNAVAASAKTTIVDQLAFRPFIGHSFSKGFVYVGGGPTLTLLETEVLDLVGFADINGDRQDISGAPQDFSDSGWVWGGSAEVGITYFVSRSWFLDCSYTLGITDNRTFHFSSTFSNTDPDNPSQTKSGTLVGSSTWQVFTQGFSVKLCKTF